MGRTIYQIKGMHCEACVQKIATALGKIVPDVRVTLDPPQAIISGDAPKLEALMAALAQAGDYKLAPEQGAGEQQTILPPAENNGWLKTYYPLFLIVGLISIVSLNGASGLEDLMLHFMAGFFIVFGFFKLLDLKGFRDAYAGYDIIAARWRAYGFIYPFLELGLGLAFLFEVGLPATLWFSMILMGVSSIGVIKALLNKQKIRCACLGTVLNLPMSTITLIEDLGMVAMAGAMLA